MTIDRLTLANPVPSPPTATDDALFAQIVATPRDRVRRGPSRRLVLALALVTAAIVTSTAVGVDRWLSGTVKPDVTKQEYRDAQSLLTLPPGVAWPVLHFPANSVTTRGGGGSFALAIATTKWECYWANAIRDGDVAGQRRAATVLHDVLANHVVIAPNGAPEDWVPSSPPAFPYEVYADDGGFQYKQRIYAAAAAGDAAGVAQSCRANT